MKKLFILLGLIISFNLGAQTIHIPIKLKGGVLIGTNKDTITNIATPDQLSDTADVLADEFNAKLDAHNLNNFVFPNGLKVGGGDTIQTIYIRDDTLFFVTSKGNYYAELATYSDEVGNPNRIYVSTSGSDSNDGRDSLHPVQSLSYAQSLASAGDTICLKRGDTWNEDYIVEITKSGVSGNPIVWHGGLWGPGGDTATIYSNHAGGDSPYWRNVIRIVACEYVVFQNIIIDGGVSTRYGLVIGGNPAFDGPTVPNNENHITVKNCEIRNIGDGTTYTNGLMVRPYKTNITDITIKDNHIHNISSHCIALYPLDESYLDGHEEMGNYNVTISGNYLHDYRTYSGNTGFALLISRTADNILVEDNIMDDDSSTNNVCVIFPMSNRNVTNTTIRYNKITARANGAACIGIFNGGPTEVKAYSNILYSSGYNGYAIRVENGYDYTGGTIEFYNNTCYVENHSKGVDDGTNVSGVTTYRNNLFYQNDASNDNMIAYFRGAGVVTHSNNLWYKIGSWVWVKDNGIDYSSGSAVQSWESTAVVTDPTFVTNFTDLHLQSGSPADGAGVAISGITLDYDGVTYDDPPAIGAYERK